MQITEDKGVPSVLDGKMGESMDGCRQRVFRRIAAVGIPCEFLDSFIDGTTRKITGGDKIFERKTEGC